MTKAQLQEIVLRFLAATPKVIVGARGIGGACRFCNAPRGIQHDSSCPTWGLIHARIEHHMLAESPARATEEAPDPVETMTLMETGGDLVPTAPTLLYAEGGHQR